MAHMVDSLSFTGETPWHGLGRRLPQHATVDEMIRFGGLDWEVIPRPLAAFADDGSGTTVPGYKALVRSDRPDVVLSVVGEGYGVVQNGDALSLAAAAVGDGNACAEVCGALDEGRRIFVVLNVREAGFDVAGERIEPYVLCYSSHDESTAVGLRFTPVRVVCHNTLTAALGQGATEIRIRHTRNAAERVKLAATVVEAARVYFGQFHQRALALAAQRIRLETFERVAESLFPTVRGKDGKPHVPVNREKLVALFARQPYTTDRAIAGTKWGAYNAVTALLDHNTRKTGGREGRMQRAITGSQDAVRHEAMRLLLAA